MCAAHAVAALQAAVVCPRVHGMLMLLCQHYCVHSAQLPATHASLQRSLHILVPGPNTLLAMFLCRAPRAIRGHCTSRQCSSQVPACHTWTGARHSAYAPRRIGSLSPPHHRSATPVVLLPTPAATMLGCWHHATGPFPASHTIPSGYGGTCSRFNTGDERSEVSIGDCCAGLTWSAGWMLTCGWQEFICCVWMHAQMPSAGNPA